MTDSKTTTPETVKEFVIEGKIGGSWETCGYRETEKEADKFLNSLQTGMAFKAFDCFRTRAVMIKWEQSEKYKRLNG